MRTPGPILALPLVAFALLAGCFNDPSDIACTDSRYCPTGFVCSIDPGQRAGVCCKSSDGITCTGRDAALASDALDSGYDSAEVGTAEAGPGADAIDVPASTPDTTETPQDAGSSVDDARDADGGTSATGDASGADGNGGDSASDGAPPGPVDITAQLTRIQYGSNDSGSLAELYGSITIDGNGTPCHLFQHGESSTIDVNLNGVWTEVSGPRCSFRIASINDALTLIPFGISEDDNSGDETYSGPPVVVRLANLARSSADGGVGLATYAGDVQVSVTGGGGFVNFVVHIVGTEASRPGL